MKNKKNVKKEYNVLEKGIPLQRFNKQMIVLQILKSKEMKKLVLMFVAVAAISFASCGNKTEQAAPVDSDSVATVDSVAADSAADSTAVADSTDNDSVQ